MRTARSLGKLAPPSLVALFVGAAGLWCFTARSDPSRITESKQPLDWKSQFGKSSAQEGGLYHYVKTIVARSAPSKYALGGRHGDIRDVWVEDLNGDGQSDLAFALTTTPPTDTILRVVTPLGLDGTSKMLAELSRNDLDIDAREGALTSVEGSVDFNHDGEIELLIEAPANKPTSEIFKIDFIAKTLSRLQARTATGQLQPVQLVSAGGFGYLVDQFLRDVDRDGTDEFVTQDRRFTDGLNETIESATLSVFKWNGTLFDYSKALSHPSTNLLDPAQDIAGGPRAR